jgi:hypothetical protein
MACVTIVALSALFVSEALNAIEQPKFELVDEFGDLQIRKYHAHVVAQTSVSASFSESGNQGFRRLAGYIFGGNRDNQEIAMTAPVGLQEIDIPTSQSQSQYLISFTMPSEHYLDDLPVPDDSRIDIAEVPERYMAVIRYRGNWSESRYRDHETQLMSLIKRNPSWVTQGTPVWSRYDPPFMPSFLRSNEVAIEVSPAAEVGH